MTPPEVVSAMVQIAFYDNLRYGWSNKSMERFVVADPTCGVGSFLAAAFRRACALETDQGLLSDRLVLFGQDKVDRMVRLANVNLKVFAQTNAEIRQGNSIHPATTLDDLAGTVDLILTNPPFGATFETAPLLRSSDPRQYPTLFELAGNNNLPRTVDSEYLLLDRELALLRPGGRLLMVVPDKVVSGSGFSEVFRLALLRRAHLVAVLDLPTETFAQAGTRTKTSVVYLQRFWSRSGGEGRRSVFMAKCDDIGFRVVSRIGVTVKKITGDGDMPKIVEKYKLFDVDKAPKPPFESLNRTPSVAVVSEDCLLNNRWNAGFYRRERHEALSAIRRLQSRGFSAQPLPSLVEIDPEEGEQVLAGPADRCVSVLHVREDGFIDLDAVEDYKPTTPCVRCRAGDVLLSRINPRIVRICVVPDLEYGLGCSSEFAVLRRPSKGNDLDAWILALILRCPVVQSQIRALTSGTSSSHNRIKPADLATTIIPVPEPDTRAHHELAQAAKDYRDAARRYYSALKQALGCFVTAHRSLDNGAD